MAPPPSKTRKRVVVSMQQKYDAIKRLDSGESVKKIANEYRVVSTTVKDCKKWCSVLAAPSPTRKTMKSSEHQKIDNALYLWFTQQRERGIPLSEPILQAKAISLGEELPVREAPETFTASDGWLMRWKKRHGIRQLKICGEKLSADAAAVKEFQMRFKLIMEEEGYTPCQIYNADETGLNFKMLPTKTLASKTESAAPGYKRSKKRVTILACSNSSGNQKLPLMCIGKSAKPRAFKHIQKNALPLY
jgi:hypothetical protein